jgi:hypothetical protein
MLKKAKVLQIERNTTYRKYNKSTHTSHVAHPMSQASLDISLVWPPTIEEKVSKLQFRPA